MPSHLPIVIAAAGLGSRLGQGRPKALVEIGGHTLIERLLTDCLADETDIRIVVGFREQDVMDHVLTIRRDVIFVRNPDYRDSLASHSYALAARAIAGPMIIVDGDLLINPNSWHAFAAAAATSDRASSAQRRSLIGVARATTQDAVYVRVQGHSPEELTVTEFTRADRQPYEWCNVACVEPAVFEVSCNFVYECCAQSLPLPGFLLDVAEVDTPSDFSAAEAWLKARS